MKGFTIIEVNITITKTTFFEILAFAFIEFASLSFVLYFGTHNPA